MCSRLCCFARYYCCRTLPICNAQKTLSVSASAYEPLKLTQSKDSILTSEQHQNAKINDRINLLEQSHHHIQNTASIKPAKNMLAGTVVFYQLVQAVWGSASYC